MGMTWRIMPLLSTLAALVIIVHSAEENLNRENRYEMTPRVLYTRSTDNQQPWRVVRDDNPTIQQSGPPDPWNNDFQDEVPVRRRVGRKRKRRPPSHSSEESDQIPEENRDEDEEEKTERPVTRRKKIKLNRPINQSEEHSRSTRRKGQRRRRPSLQTWPELSEFDSYPRNHKLLEANEQAIQVDIDDDEIGNDPYSQVNFNSDDDIREIRVKNRRPAPESRFVIQQLKQPPTEDKSLSEFSVEVMVPFHAKPEDNEYDFTELKDKVTDKTPEAFNGMVKAKDHGPIDPHTLKDILKRSNGTSLSEILQQHNLTLADLLNGKENAISVLQSGRSVQNSDKFTTSEVKPINSDIEKTLTESLENVEIDSAIELQSSSIDPNRNIENISVNNVPQQNNTTFHEETQIIPEIKEDLVSVQQDMVSEETPKAIKVLTATPKMLQRTSIMLARRPMQGTIRRKLRMRPIVNNTYKSQINRDLMTLNARRYVHHNRRNVTKSKAKEWKEMVPLMVNVNITEQVKSNENKTVTTTTSNPEETTTSVDLDEPTETTILYEPVTVSNGTYDEKEEVNSEATTVAVEILATELENYVTEKLIVNRSTLNPTGLRRQSYNNRLKKKRMRQKTSTTEALQDDIMKNLLELGDLVSSSQFIARTQMPKATSLEDRTETATELEDFLTTQAVTKGSVRSTRLPPTRKSFKSPAVSKSPILTSTEETAKIEIEEILNDTRTSAKLSKILKDRNMTLSELLEHRERGSSHVHLADIFHNASREPNPPEPFLSKSLIEPISKETYPLRALLDANLHDPTTKTTTVDPVQSNHINIPVIMDFGNNVNENAENMGIMSLFNNFTKGPVSTNAEKSTLQKDSNGTPYKLTVTTVNATDDDDDETTRESRMLGDEEDMISWNEIFSMIRKNHKNETKALEKLTSEISPSGVHKKITLEEDTDGDGVIVLEDLQHLKDLGSNVASNSEEKVETNTLERAEIMGPGILNKTPNSTKSVTVATASIVGLAMILFLLTYAALKWRQQRTVSHKKAFGDERIPSPVFENRKGTKNCSSRSISPMLPTSNIYTMNTLDSQNGKDSPEYMWDSLRKPFQ